VSDAYRQIVDQVTAIVTGLATTGANVFESPTKALDSGALAALAVQPRDVDVAETWESADTDDHLELHRIGVEITTVALTIAARDQSALEVKEAILNQARPGYARRYRRSDFQESGEGERPYFALRQRFEIDYHVEATAPDVIVQG
jgi:hypothetical protein